MSNALRGLTDAMRLERTAKLSYQGNAWDADGAQYISATKQARLSFEMALERFVDLLARS